MVRSARGRARVGAACLLLALAAGRDAAKGEPVLRPMTAVWIDHPLDPGPATHPVAARRLEEIGVSLIRERLAAAPDRALALDILAAHRAVAVMWRDPDGELAILVHGGERPDPFRVEAGSPDEEALYVRELLAVRVLGEHPAADLLVTAPREEVPAAEPRQLRLTRPRPSPEAAGAPDRPPGSGIGLALGWRWRAHPDESTWSEHAIAAQLPAWRFDSGFALRLTGAIGLPVVIGEPGAVWLELSSLAAALEAGVRPLRGRLLDAEIYCGAGAYRLRASAFLPDGTARLADHLSGQVTIGAGIALRPGGPVELRFHGGLNRVLRPGWFSIAGRGDFGAAPRQPFVGLDLSVAVPSGRAPPGG